MKKLTKIAEFFRTFSIELYFVGGCVRDKQMNLAVEDYDICIVGGKNALHITSLLEESIQRGLIDKFTSVYGSFPIWIVEVDFIKYEFAMARKEKKVGQTRTEFLTEVRDVTIEEDLLRRDLTINAIANNLLTGKIVDPHGGIEDIKNKIARHVSDAFAEDSLRVIRAARFIARFDLTPSPSLIEICKSLKPYDISNERVGMELMKTLKQASKPSSFFNFLRSVDWLKFHFGEINDLIGVPQSPIHHPEGDAYTHTMHCIDAVHTFGITVWFFRAVMLCHDLGKATHTTVEEHSWSDWKKNIGYKDYTLPKNTILRIKSIGHEEAGMPLTRQLLQRIHFCDHETIRKIACLVGLHMTRAIINGNNYDKMVRRTLRNLIKHNLSYSDLLLVTYFDLAGRPPLSPPDFVKLSLEMFNHHATRLTQENEMVPIVTGEKLLALGLPSGPRMGEVITHALELQDRGTLKHDNWIPVLHGAHPDYFKLIKNE